MVIWFNVREAREYLTENGFIYTVRTSRKQFGNTSAIYYDNIIGDKFFLFKVNVEQIDESYEYENKHKNVLEKYLEHSGFKSIEDWIKKVRMLRKNRWIPEYIQILKVERID